MKRKHTSGQDGKAATNDKFANYLRKDSYTKSVNRHTKKVKAKKRGK